MISPQLTFGSLPVGKAPRTMYYGSATAHFNFAYFVPGGSTSVYRCGFDTNQWEKLPSCPHANAGLVTIHGELTTVGGYDTSVGRSTNELFTLDTRGWVEKYPPMKTARSSPAATTSTFLHQNHLIVIGGNDVSGWTATVELYHFAKKEWYTLADLPQPLPHPSLTTIHGEVVHVTGYEGQGYSSILPPTINLPIARPISISWNPLPPLPVTWSKPISYAGQLLLVGGKGRRSQVTSVYHLRRNKWVEIGSIPLNRKDCLVANDGYGKLIIVGGRLMDGGPLDLVEKCAFTPRRHTNLAAVPLYQ